MRRRPVGRVTSRITGLPRGSGALAMDDDIRAAYQAQIDSRGEELLHAIDPSILEDIERLRLGRRKKSHVPNMVSTLRTHACSASLVGALFKPDDDFPVSPYPELPEVVLVGRSNSGKSALLNALTGTKPQDGPASVSSRPGWTTYMQIFEIYDAKPNAPPIMALVDIPGYGPAPHSSGKQQLRWSRTIRSYLKTREQLACAFVLIDASLGVTRDDERFLDMLDHVGVEYHGVLTKADLLTPSDLAVAYALAEEKVASRPGYAGGDLPMVSAKHAAGVSELWERMRLGVEHELHTMVDELSAHGNGYEEDEEVFADAQKRGPIDAAADDDQHTHSLHGAEVSDEQTRVRRRRRRASRSGRRSDTSAAGTTAARSSRLWE